MPPRLVSDLSGIIKDAGWFPAALDGYSGQLGFVRTTRTVLSRLSFLDGREPLSLPGGKRLNFPLEAFGECQKENGDALPREWNFIFHTGFCCSTLLARCLDLDGVCLALKEPAIFNDLAGAKRFSLPLWRRSRTALNVALGLLSRPSTEGEQIVIKPSNAANCLIPDILSANPGARMLFLQSDLREFLIAVAKGGKPRRQFVRLLLAAYLPEAPARDVVTLLPHEGGLPHLNDLQAAALLWKLQTAEFAAIRERHPKANIRALNASELLRDPTAAMAEAARFFGVANEEASKLRKRMPAVLSRHAKGPEFTYSPEVRRAELRAIESYLGKALEETLAWAEQTRPDGRATAGLKIAI